MFEIGHKLVGYFCDDGIFYPLMWDDGREVYFDELRCVLDEQNRKICAFERKCAKIRKPKMFNKHQIARIKQRRREGASLRCIAREMGCSEGTVRNYLKRE